MADAESDLKLLYAKKFFGSCLFCVYIQAQIIDMAPIDGSQNFRVIMRYTAGVQYGIGSEIVLYHA